MKWFNRNKTDNQDTSMMGLDFKTSDEESEKPFGDTEANTIPENSTTPEPVEQSELVEQPEAVPETVEQQAEQISDQVLEDRKWLEEYIAKEFPDADEALRQQIIEKYTTPEAKQSLKEWLVNILPELSVGGLVGVLGKVGLGYSVSALKTALTYFTLGGAAVAGGVAGAIISVARTYWKERIKVDKSDFDRQIMEANQAQDFVTVAQIIGKAEGQYKNGEFSDEESEVVRKQLLRSKVELDLSMHAEKHEGSSEKDKVDLILKSLTQARKEISKDDRKEVKELLKEISFNTEKNAFNNYRVKLGTALFKGAAVGVFGAMLGGALHEYLGGYITEKIGNAAAYFKGAPQELTTVQLAQVEAANERAIEYSEKVMAAAAQATEDARQRLIDQDMSAVAERGDGALNMYRKMVHDYLVNDGRLGGNGLNDYSKEELIYAEEYLNKHNTLDFGDGDTHIDENDIASLDVRTIQDALEQAKQLTTEQAEHLESLLENPPHDLSDESIAEMQKDAFNNAANDYTNIEIDPIEIAPPSDVVETISTDATPTPETTPVPSDATPTPQPTPTPEVVPTVENTPAKTDPNKSNWMPWAVGATGVAIAAGAAGIYAMYRKGSRDGVSEEMEENVETNKLDVVYPTDAAELKKAEKQSGKLARVFKRYGKNLQDKQIIIHADGIEETRIEGDVVHINVFDKSATLNAFFDNLFGTPDNSVNPGETVESVDNDAESKTVIISSGVSVERTEATPEKQVEFFENNNVEIHGDEYYGERLTTEYLSNAGLAPEYIVNIENVQLRVSKPFRLSSQRIAIINYVKENNHYVARAYYRSSSSGLWRYLPAYLPDGHGGVDWFDKAMDEEAITAPAEVQQAMAYLSNDDSAVLTPENPYFLFAGTAKDLHTMSERTVIREVDHESIPFPAVIESKLGRTKIEPEKIEITDEAFKPDFTRGPVMTWRQSSNLYRKVDQKVGYIEYELFASQNNKIGYIIGTDELNRSWVATVEANGKIGSTGLLKKWVKGGDLVTPAFEYDSQIDDPKNANFDIRRGNYVDMYQNYISRIPLMKEYLAWKNGSRNDAGQPVINIELEPEPVAEPVAEESRDGIEDLEQQSLESNAASDIGMEDEEAALLEPELEGDSFVGHESEAEEVTPEVQPGDETTSSEYEAEESLDEYEDNKIPLPQPDFTEWNEEVGTSQTEEIKTTAEKRPWKEVKAELEQEGKLYGLANGAMESWVQLMRPDKTNIIQQMIDKQALPDDERFVLDIKQYIQDGIKATLENPDNPQPMLDLYTYLLTELPVGDKKKAQKSDIKKLIGLVGSVTNKEDTNEALQAAIKISPNEKYFTDVFKARARKK